jgi:hypothetical protein
MRQAGQRLGLICTRALLGGVALISRRGSAPASSGNPIGNLPLEGSSFAEEECIHESTRGDSWLSAGNDRGL